MPETFADYREITGKELDPKLFMSRIGNMFRDNSRRGVWCVGPEHPSVHPDLKDLYALTLKEWTQN